MAAGASKSTPDPLIQRALDALEGGRLVGLPTETVYGLAGDASNPEALRRIFELKGRPADHPVIVHLGDVAWIERWARVVPRAAVELAERFWPGPLTLILRRRPKVSDLITGGQDTVGLRMPNHPLALQLLRAFGRGLAAPSANRFGHVSPTTAAHVEAEFGSQLPIVLDGGPCEVGIESTIVDLSSDEPRILRPGRIPAEAVAQVLGREVLIGAREQSPRVSGALESHYAPRAPAELLLREDLERRWHQLPRDSGQGPVQLLVLDQLPAGAQGLALPSEPEPYARGLYAALRDLDRRDPTAIWIEAPPETAAWSAILDRLRRASNNPT